MFSNQVYLTVAFWEGVAWGVNFFKTLIDSLLGMKSATLESYLYNFEVINPLFLTSKTEKIGYYIQVCIHAFISLRKFPSDLLLLRIFSWVDVEICYMFFCIHSNYPVGVFFSLSIWWITSLHFLWIQQAWYFCVTIHLDLFCSFSVYCNIWHPKFFFKIFASMLITDVGLQFYVLSLFLLLLG